jgi:hypothetical protein
MILQPPGGALAADVARKFLAALMDHKELRGLLSDEHFSVDGTQIAPWASMNSFKAKGGSGDPPGPGRNGERDFHGEKRRNATHASTTDPEVQFTAREAARKPKLSFMGHALMENRSGLIVAATLTKATGTAERKAAEAMIVRYSPAVRRLTLGGDKIRFVSRSGNSNPLTQCGRRFRGILAAADRYASDVCYRSVSGIWMVTRSSSRSFV